LATGLDDAEAQRRLRVDGPNELETPKTRSWWSRIAAQFTDPLVLLLLGAIAISLVAWWLEEEGGFPVDAIVIAVIVILNAGLGAVQEERAEAAVAALTRMTAARATVLRGGRRSSIPSRDVVAGDVLLIEEGDAVTADARVVTSTSLSVAEASLTGESEAVAKSTDRVGRDAALGDRTSMVFAGTAAVAGHGTALVTGTGMTTEVGHIATMLNETERLPTPLEREIAHVGKVLGIAVVLISLIVIGTSLVVSDINGASDVVEVLLIGVSLAVAAVPEGLPAVLSIVLAIGVQRMAGRHALVKRLASAETLGSATVICTDKTGTLTRSEMTVREVITADDRVEIDAVGYDPTLLVTDRALHPSVVAALAAGAQASNANVIHSESGWTAVGAPTEAAVVVAARRLGWDESTAATRLDEIPFSSERKRMSVLVDGADGPQHLIKGAPDVVLDLCSQELRTDGVSMLSDDRRERWSNEIDRLADGAMRTLAIAGRHHSGEGLSEADESGLTIFGVIGIIDPPRPEAIAAVRETHAAGIRVVMITGDHPRTAGQIAADIGIAARGARVLTGPELELMDDAALAEAAASTDVFARVAPAHKLRLVEALQARGEVVAMTGDGVNDAPALKAADIGTAMGITGTDVARDASDMVLTDDNFATITAAVAEGRSIFHNIKSFLRYLLSSNIGEVFTMFFGVVLAGVLGLTGNAAVIAPLTATQILWINLLTDTGPALALGVDPGEPDLMQRVPRPLGSRVIDAPMQHGILLVGLTMAVATLTTLDAYLPGGLIDGSSSLDKARTAAFTVLVLAQLFNCFSARSDTLSAFHHWAINRWLLLAVAGSVALQLAVVYLPFLQEAMGTASLSATDWVLTVAMASTVLWVAEVRKWLRRRATGVTGSAAPRRA
jgi:calcium-translocating P-type ATPase